MVGILFVGTFSNSLNIGLFKNIYNDFGENKEDGKRTH